DSARLNHADPLILLVLDSITRGYLRPYLEESGVSDPTEYLIWRDFTDLTSRTVTAEDARHAYADGVISEDAYRGVLGFTEQDAPDDSERAERAERGDIRRQSEPTGENIPRQPPALVAAASEISLDALADLDQRLYLQIAEASQAALD